MPPVVCPSCRCKLKAPAKLIGKKATCPKCQAAILVPAAEVGGDFVSAETKVHRKSVSAPDAETSEALALDATAEQSPLKPAVPTFAGQPAPVERRRGGLLIRAVVFIILACAGGFAVWMAIPQSPEARGPHPVQPRR